MEDQDINGDITMPTTAEDQVEEKSQMIELIEEAIETSSKNSEIASESLKKELAPIDIGEKVDLPEKTHRYVRIGEYLYMSEIIKPYIRDIDIVYKSNLSLFNSNPIDIYNLDNEITIFNLDTTIGQTLFNEALEKLYIKETEPINVHIESNITRDLEVVDKLIAKYQLSQRGGSQVDSSNNLKENSSQIDPSDELIVEDRTDLEPKIDKNDNDIIIDSKKSITITINNDSENVLTGGAKADPTETDKSNIKKITIVTDGKKMPRQPLDDFPETRDIDDMIVEDSKSIVQSKEQKIQETPEIKTQETHDIGYRVENYYIYGNYKYNLENIENLLGKDHAKVFLGKLQALPINTYLDPSSLRKLLNKDEIRHSMEVYGNLNNA